MIHIAMIEDDVQMAELIGEFLAKHNIKVTNYETPHVGLSALKFEKFDLLILDLSLPDMDGLEVCRLVREFSDIPIIISSARSDMSDKSACFYMGADDYMPKPYDSKELLLRIHSVLRRYKKEPLVKEKEMIFTFSKERQEVRKNGEILYLTNAEFEIMAYFIKRSGFALSREEIISNVEAINYESSTKSIDVMIGRLRLKIEENPKKPRYIISLRGIGYKLINE
ncbi:MAG: DNA-binding response regulator [Epsilonproteobacteria bacterium]|nr:MAG: DNA-binding response regulator [Campylobacterota bacterium]